MSRWSLQRVARPGQPADNAAAFAPRTPPGRRQVWITRLGSHTRVLLVKGAAAEREVPGRVSRQSWA